MKAADIIVSTGLWVTGSVLYQLAVGSRPFAGDFIFGGVMLGATLAIVAAIRS